MNNAIEYLAAGALVSGLLALMLYMVLSMPVVQVDRFGNCLSVLSPGGEYSCSNKPERYDVSIIR